MLKEARFYTISTFCEGKRDIMEMYMNRFADTVARIAEQVPGFDIHVVQVSARPCEDKITKRRSGIVDIQWYCKSSEESLEALISYWNQSESLPEFSEFLIDVEY